jgi:catechol 2,3-dioxygenase-like lactoylglutathione lyase family enzyme
MTTERATGPVEAMFFGAPTPILPVRNLAASVDYYVNALGFQLDWSDPSGYGFASLSRGKCHLFLAEGDQGQPGGVWVWVGVGDAERLRDDYRRRGARIRHPPSNFSWAYEMQVEDLDGNVLRMGSDPLPDQPPGPWLDMRGTLWKPLPDGGWTAEGHG